MKHFFSLSANLRTHFLRCSYSVLVKVHPGCNSFCLPLPLLVCELVFTFTPRKASTSYRFYERQEKKRIVFPKRGNAHHQSYFLHRRFTSAISEGSRPAYRFIFKSARKNFRCRVKGSGPSAFLARQTGSSVTSGTSQNLCGIN